MSLFKIGDKVKIRRGLKSGAKGPTGIGFVVEMESLCGNTVTISDVRNHSKGVIYNVEENGYNWDETWFYKTKVDGSGEETEEDMSTVTEAMEKINKTLEKLNGSMNKRTLYDEAIQDAFSEKIKKVPLEEIRKDLIDFADKYIKDTYNLLPKKIEIIDNLKKKEVSGLFHKKFEEILKIVNKGIPLMLTGPAGAGKNHTLEQVAEALDLDFYFSNAVTQEYKLTGFIDAGGRYQETQFYKAYKDGGLFFLDEVDASVPEALIIMNCAIANGYFDFPIGRVNANENFRIVCAGNTFGTGADMVYVGRNALDGATLDRFAVIDFDYDEDIERSLAFEDELYDFIKSLRKSIKNASLRYIVSMRATINASKMLEIGMNRKDILRSVIIKNMQIDDLNVIIKDMDENNSWVKDLRGIMNERSKA